MPEGPSVRKFHHLVSPFVGQQVVKTGGSSKKLPPATLQSLWFQDAQVHGKKLFLQFDPDEEMALPGTNPLAELVGEGKLEKEAMGPEPALGPSTQEPSAGSQCVELVSRDSSGRSGHSPAAGAQRWLEIRFGLFGSIWVNNFSRAKKANKRGDWSDPVPRLVLYFGGGDFLAFYNCQMSWSPPPVVEPTCDILSEKFHRGQALEALGQAQPVCYTLLDQRYFSGLDEKTKAKGVLLESGTAEKNPRSLPLNSGEKLCHLERDYEALGKEQSHLLPLLNRVIVQWPSGLESTHWNIIKNEALYRARIHPLSLGSLLSSSHLETLVDHVVKFSTDWLQVKFQGKGWHKQIYQKEQCPAGHQVMKEALGPPGGFQRLTWWCPECQPQLPQEEPQKLQNLEGT